MERSESVRRAKFKSREGAEVIPLRSLTVLGAVTTFAYPFASAFSQSRANLGCRLENIYVAFISNAMGG